DLQASGWRQVGTVPGGRELVAVGHRLYCLSTGGGRPELWSRPNPGPDEAWEQAGDYPALKGKPDQWRLGVWRGQVMAWSMSDDRILARAAGAESHPWLQVGKKDPDFLRRWGGPPPPPAPPQGAH